MISQAKQVLWIATTNKGKIKEFEILLPEFKIKTLLDLPDYKDIEENGTTFQENALIKAKDLAKFVNGIAIGDDSGLAIDIFDGFPGIYSKRWAYPVTDFIEMSKILLDRMKEYNNDEQRVAKMITSIAFYDSRNNFEKVVYEEVIGKIAHKITGDLHEGFGYDHIFIPTPGDLTYTQLGHDVKNKNSARQRAVESFKKFIESYNGK